MRYMMLMQVEPEAAARAAEDLDLEEVVATMGAYNEELQKAGVFLSAEGLTDASEGFRVDFSSTPPVVTDGPYAEAREVFTGFWMLEVADREEAELWARKCPLGPGVALEVRPIGELDEVDLPADNDWLVKAQEWRAANT
ncbi:YciI family protein [Microbacterium pumilum]|uniref:YciI family protein n=1 Tax=Microbacterium pumilum TaxID=344165 RepID=A0ABP5DEB3_9MICO